MILLPEKRVVDLGGHELDEQLRDVSAQLESIALDVPPPEVGELLALRAALSHLVALRDARQSALNRECEEEYAAEVRRREVVRKNYDFAVDRIRSSYGPPPLRALPVGAQQYSEKELQEFKASQEQQRAQSEAEKRQLLAENPWLVETLRAEHEADRRMDAQRKADTRDAEEAWLEHSKGMVEPSISSRAPSLSDRRRDFIYKFVEKRRREREQSQI